MPREKGSKNVNPVHFWTEEELEFLREQYPLHDSNELLVLFNERFNIQLTLFQLKSVLNRYKIHCGRTGQWQKGLIPYTKGKKWDEYMSKEAQENSRKTCFNKERTVNNPNITDLPVGTERYHKGYVIVRTDKQDGLSARRYWKFKHHLIWEEAYGPIPEGQCVIFADGNRLNFDINNLILVTRGELGLMNKEGLYYKGNADATKCGVTLSKLMLKGNYYAKKQTNRSK